MTISSNSETYQTESQGDRTVPHNVKQGTTADVRDQVDDILKKQQANG